MIGIFVGLGANVGDREANIRRALGQLNRLPDTEVRRVASLYETEAVGGQPGQVQPPYLNTVCELSSHLGARELLWHFLLIENRLGRVREERWGARTIDLDLLLYGNHVIGDSDLTIPHPEMHHRGFVLVPLLELAPHVVHPTFHKTVRELALEHEESEGVRSLGRFWYQDAT